MLSTSPLGTPDIVADIALHLPMVQPPAPPSLGTSDTAVGTSPQLPAALPPTPPFLVTSGIATGTSPQLLAMLLRDWEDSFMEFKAFFDGGAKILRSIDELLPLCHRFDGYAPFQGAFVYPKTVTVLRKFMDQYGSFMEITGITPSSIP
ncbi:hypothetical protein L3X38_042693 [Prunus dulcis]|uniref:Uncharacterized protein n=1 Tax=Prunus dulcis TaxID=3755 RepID=A0AAD4UXE3_PRUDU|nr:hypothetical protein L3X38_042693 [Prunus dulcis]